MEMPLLKADAASCSSLSRRCRVSAGLNQVLFPNTRSIHKSYAYSLNMVSDQLLLGSVLVVLFHFLSTPFNKHQLQWLIGRSVLKYWESRSRKGQASTVSSVKFISKRPHTHQLEMGQTWLLMEEKDLSVLRRTLRRRLGRV